MVGVLRGVEEIVSFLYFILQLEEVGLSLQGLGIRLGINLCCALPPTDCFSNPDSIRWA
ncbi:MAG: hypothetical protein QXS76_02670 [Candidatus Bathyarchaeia archaeon]